MKWQSKCSFSQLYVQYQAVDMTGRNDMLSAVALSVTRVTM